MQSNEHTEVVVVGGGVSGLAAATYLARKSKPVRLLEQSQALGGRARTKQQDGFLLNIGPHALYRGGRGIEVLRELGIEPSGKVPAVSGAFVVKDGVKHTFPVGLASLLTTSLFGLAAKLETARFLASLPKLNGKTVMNVSLLEWLEANISYREVQDFLLTAFRIATYTNAPELMSAGTAIEQLKLAFQSNVLYLDGGWQTLVDGLAKAAEQAGVAIETGVKVEAVERDASGAVTGVRTEDGRVLRATNVVIASSPAIAARLVERGEDSSLQKWADESIPVRAACLDVALRSSPVPRASAAFSVDRPLYLSVHSASAKLAPDGGALIHLAMYLPPDYNDSPEAAEVELEGLLDLVQPRWHDALVYRRFLPDMIVMNAMTRAQAGGVEGRPSPAVEDVPGLYVVGDWVGKEGLLVDASLSSARQASELIVSRRNVRTAAVV
ncbi:MAG TPA: NAD(P)/FAD-dependent oxidoreductase [Blastocatellia bacterium]|nr:NAD(P)/FAD-dependent oxidoreductase [Blastocatellia bacterium]